MYCLPSTWEDDLITHCPNFLIYTVSQHIPSRVTVRIELDNIWRILRTLSGIKWKVNKCNTMMRRRGRGWEKGVGRRKGETSKNSHPWQEFKWLFITLRQTRIKVTKTNAFFGYQPFSALLNLSLNATRCYSDQDSPKCIFINYCSLKCKV